MPHRSIKSNHPSVSASDVERLLLEIFSQALIDAREAGDIHDATGDIDWRRHVAVDLLERWGPAFDSLYRRYREGPPA